MSLSLDIKVLPSHDTSSNLTITTEQLTTLVESRNIALLKKLGNVMGIAQFLGIDLYSGLSDDSRQASQSLHGRNELAPKPPPSLLHLMRNALMDRMLLLLMAAALISLSIGIYRDIHEGTVVHWIEGAAILMAVLIVVLANALNDYQREWQFRKLSKRAEDRLVRTLKQGKPTEISIFELAVGDILLFEPGEVVPVDGILIEGFNVECDESAATGESEAVRKETNINEGDPFLLSGTKIIDGTGSMLVVAVGCHSFYGRMLTALQEESTPTPLQIKLASLADGIAKLGAAIALLMLFTLSIKYVLQLSFSRDPIPSTTIIIEQILLIIIETVTVVVVAVPEGLPMAVTLALAYATTRMLQDNNLVRVLAACETMGNATCICSDKTGTLTENRMTVVRALIGGVGNEDNGDILVNEEINDEHEPFIDKYKPSTEHAEQPTSERDLYEFTTISPDSKTNLPIEPKIGELLSQAIAINSTAFEHANQGFVGNKTEVALLQFMVRHLNPSQDYLTMRREAIILDVFPFSSTRKSMTTVVKLSDDMVRIFVKGASEIILNGCTQWLKQNTNPTSISPNDLRYLRRFIAEMAESSLRTIAIAYRDMTLEEYSKNRVDLSNITTTTTANNLPPSLEKLALLSILGIEDPLRVGVTKAVEQCQRAGIFVRMVTGDNLMTAQAIGRKCGILMRGGITMEGARFRQLDNQALETVIPRLQVLARSTPLDKQILVKKLREMGEIVAVTGDGSNDGPALKSANVGFAMGIAGTEVAKEASSIVLLDDNFASIVKAVSWGRCVNDSVRKFLQFQLTVNISAVFIAFASAVIDPGGKSILNVVQLLWVNLIMDTLAALALATDKPAPDILNRLPETPNSNLVTSPMLKMILGQALFQVAVILFLLHYGQKLLRLRGDGPDTDLLLATFIFNTFVFLQLANEINCRIVQPGEYNPFRGILTNWIFLIIMVGTILVQVMVVTGGGIVFGTTSMPLYCWLISVGVSLISWPLALAIRWLPDFSSRRNTSLYRTPAVTRQQLHWQAAIDDVRRSLAFYSAIRRSMKPTISVTSYEGDG